MIVFFFTVAEKDTAAAAQAALGPPIGCGWPPRLQPRLPIRLKIDSLAYECLTSLLSSTHAQAVSLSRHRPHDMHSIARWVITAINTTKKRT